MIQTTDIFLRKTFYFALSFIFVACNTSCLSVYGESLSDSQLFDVQQAYGQKVQQKTSANKHNGTTSSHVSKSSLLSKSFFKSKTFNKTLSKAAIKQFQVQFKIGNSYNVQQFGAKGDGVTDDQAAIDQTIARAKGTGLSVYFPPGNYLHSDLIVADSVTLFGAGSSTMLTATTSTNGAIQLTGDGASLKSMAVNYLSPSPVPSYDNLDSTPQAGAIWVQSANNFSISQITISNSSNNGIDILQSNNGTIRSNLLTGASYSGMQIVDCNNVQILNNNVQGAQYNDAVNIFFGNTGSQNLTIAYNYIFSSGGDGNTIYLTGLASSHIVYNNLSASAPDSVGGPAIIWIADEASGVSSGFGPIINLEISGNTINGNGSVAGIYQSSGNGSLSNVQITNNTIINSAYDGIYLREGNNIYVSSNIIDGVIYGDGNGDGIDFYTGSNITVQSNIVRNIDGYGIYINAEDNLDSSSVCCSNNNFSNCCISFGNVLDFENNGTYTTLSIINNNYMGPANLATYYIQCLVPSAGITRTLSGNTQATVLPNNVVP